MVAGIFSWLQWNEARRARRKCVRDGRLVCAFVAAAVCGKRHCETAIPHDPLPADNAIAFLSCRSPPACPRHRDAAARNRRAQHHKVARGAKQGFNTPFKTWTRNNVEFQGSHVNMKGEMELPKVLKYDAADMLTGWGFLSVLLSEARVGTVFGDIQFLLKYLGLVVVAAVTRYGLTVGLPYKEIVRYAADLGELTDFLNGSLAFLLGLYLSNTLNRWWAVRERCVGEHWRAINDLCMLAGVWFSSNATADVSTKSLIRRYGLLASALLYKQAKGEGNNLDDLVDCGLLLPRECEELAACPKDKSEAVWAWIADLWTRLFECGRTPKSADASLVMRRCLEGRTAAQRATTYTDTQLPLAYVHLLSFVVNLALFLNAVDAGVSGAVVPELLVTDIIAASRLLLFFVIFNGLLALAAELESPLAGGDAIDFPELAYQKALADETAMLVRAPSQGRRESEWWADALYMDDTHTPTKGTLERVECDSS